ncbi:MAG: DJ-1/PfpI family protein, partial [Rhodoglobus sp.]
MKALLLLLVMASLAEAKPKNVAIVIYDGAEILDFAGPTEVLSVASGFARSGGEKAMNVYLVARTLKPVKMQGFVEVTPQFSIDNAPVPDLVVIPGGGSEGLEDPAMMTWLLKVTSASQTTLTVCTGA